jgi:hypothetical protein
MMRAAALALLAATAAAAAACEANTTPQPDAAATLPTCVPNRDGMITAAELPIALGATVSYYASPAGATRTVDLAGTGSGATLDWDLAQPQGSDVVVALGPIALRDQWYASQFPASEFELDAGGGLDGVYHQTDEALFLDGTASHDENPAAGKTLIVYAAPVAVLRLPIVDGDAYSTLAQIPAATIDGLPFIGTDEFDVDITGSGRLDVPDVEFSPVLRARTLVTRKPSTGTPVITKRSTDFLFECFGQVAHAESLDNEPDPDFTTAAYLRRFALGQEPGQD